MESRAKLQRASADPLSQSLPTHRIKNLMTDKNSTKEGGKILSLVFRRLIEEFNLVVNINSH